MRVEADVCATLETLGIVRIDQLLALPRSGLRTRFGDALLRRLDQAIGRVPEPIEVHVAPPALEVQYLLEHPLRQGAQLTAILRLLADQLAAHLWQRNRGVIQLECECRLQDRTTVTVSIGLYQPSTDSEQFVQLLNMRWKTGTWTAPVIAVILRATYTAELELTQEMLWGEESQPDRHSLGQLVERLSSRLGKDAVVGVRLRAEHQPERAVHWVPVDWRASGGTCQYGGRSCPTCPASSSPPPGTNSLPPAPPGHHAGGTDRHRLNMNGRYIGSTTVGDRSVLRRDGGEGSRFSVITIGSRTSMAVVSGFFAMSAAIAGICMAALCKAASVARRPPGFYNGAMDTDRQRIQDDLRGLLEGEVLLQSRFRPDVCHGCQHLFHGPVRGRPSPWSGRRHRLRPLRRRAPNRLAPARCGNRLVRWQSRGRPGR